MSTRRWITALALAGACAGAQAASPPGNLLVNGDFEADYRITGWNASLVTSTRSLAYVIDGTQSVYTNICFLMVCEDTLTSGASIIQLVSTSAGQSYDFSFAARSGNAPGKIALFWDGLLVQQMDVPAGPVQTFEFDGLTASGAGTRIALYFRNPSNGGLSLDNLVLQPSTVVAVPEASQAAMLLAGLGLVGLARRRSRPPRFT